MTTKNRPSSGHAKRLDAIGLDAIGLGAEGEASRARNSESGLAAKERAFLDSGRKEIELNQQNLGLIGRLFGSGGQAQTNIAAFTIFLMVALMVVVLFLPNAKLEPKDLLTIVSGALGYVFGRGGGERAGRAAGKHEH